MYICVMNLHFIFFFCSCDFPCSLKNHKYFNLNKKRKSNAESVSFAFSWRGWRRRLAASHSSHLYFCTHSQVYRHGKGTNTSSNHGRWQRWASQLMRQHLEAIFCQLASKSDTVILHFTSLCYIMDGIFIISHFYLVWLSCGCTRESNRRLFPSGLLAYLSIYLSFIKIILWWQWECNERMVQWCLCQTSFL